MVSDIPNQEQILLAESGHVEVIIYPSAVSGTPQRAKGGGLRLLLL